MAIFLLCGFMEYGDKGVEKPIKNALKKVVVLNVFHMSQISHSKILQIRSRVLVVTD